MVRGGSYWHSLRAAGLLEHLGSFKRSLREFVFESPACVQALSDLLMTVKESEALNRTETFQIKTPTLVLDIDIPGLGRDILEQVLARQKNSFFSAGELMQPQLCFASSRSAPAAQTKATPAQRQLLYNVLSYSP